MEAIVVAVSRSPNQESARDALRYLAIRRWEHQRRGRRLAADIRAAVARATELGIQRKEIAKLLRIDRSGLYRTYLGDESSATEAEIDR